MENIESVWDYPRPPRLEPFRGHIRIVHRGEVIADSNQCYRVLETSHPPTYYIPLNDVKGDYLQHNGHQSWCEFKGQASYVNLKVAGNIIDQVGWYYPDPNSQFQKIKDHL